MVDPFDHAGGAERALTGRSGPECEDVKALENVDGDPFCKTPCLQNFVNVSCCENGFCRHNMKPLRLTGWHPCASETPGTCTMRRPVKPGQPARTSAPPVVSCAKRPRVCRRPHRLWIDGVRRPLSARGRRTAPIRLHGVRARRAHPRPSPRRHSCTRRVQPERSRARSGDSDRPIRPVSPA